MSKLRSTVTGVYINVCVAMHLNLQQRYSCRFEWSHDFPGWHGFSTVHQVLVPIICLLAATIYHGSHGLDTQFS